jgi:hypothetical protein
MFFGDAILHSVSGRPAIFLFRQDMMFIMNFCDLISCSLRDLQSPSIEVLFTTTWEIWNARNALAYEGVVVTINDIY